MFVVIYCHVKFPRKHWCGNSPVSINTSCKLSGSHGKYMRTVTRNVMPPANNADNVTMSWQYHYVFHVIFFNQARSWITGVILTMESQWWKYSSQLSGVKKTLSKHVEFAIYQCIILHHFQFHDFAFLWVHSRYLGLFKLAISNTD